MTDEERVRVDEALADYDKQVEAARNAGLPLNEAEISNIRKKKEEEILNSIRTSVPSNEEAKEQNDNNEPVQEDGKSYSAPKTDLKNKNAVSRGSKKAKMIPAMLGKLSEKWNKLQASIDNELSAHLGKVSARYDEKIKKAEDKLETYEAKIQEKIADKVAKENYAKEQLEANKDPRLENRLEARRHRAEYVRAIKESNVRNKFKKRISYQETKIKKLRTNKVKALGRRRPLMVTQIMLAKLFKNGFDRRLRVIKDSYESNLVDYIEKLPVDLSTEEVAIAQEEFKKFIDNIEGAKNKKEVENRYDEAIAYFNGKYLKPINNGGNINNEINDENTSKDPIEDKKMAGPAESIEQQIHDLLMNYKSKDPENQVRDLISAEGLCRTIGDNETADKINAEINRIVSENRTIFEPDNAEKQPEKEAVDEVSTAMPEAETVPIEEEMPTEEVASESQEIAAPIPEPIPTNPEMMTTASVPEQNIDAKSFGSPLTDYTESSRQATAEDAQLFDMLLNLKDYKADIIKRQERLGSLEQALKENEERLSYISNYINTTQKNIDELRNDNLLASDDTLSQKTQIISNLERDNLTRRAQMAELEKQVNFQKQNLSAGKETLNSIVADKEELEKKIASFQAGAKVSQGEIDDFKKRTDDYAEQTRLLAQEQAKMQYRRENTENIDREIADRRTYETLRNNLYSSVNIDDDSEYPPRSR